MSDLIKREDAIKAVMQKPAIHGSEGSWYRADDIRDALEKAPSADRPQKWISCSERLPEERGSYLTWSAIGFIPDHVDEPDTYEGVTIASFSKDLCEWFGAEKVYAWMPLPKPWKGADDDCD